MAFVNHILVFLLLSAVLLSGCLQSTPASESGFRVLTEEFPPYNFMENGRVSGQSTEVVLEIMNRTGESAEIEFMSFSDAYVLLLSRPNTVFYSVGRTPQRELLFKWVGPVGSWDLDLYSRADVSASADNLAQAKHMGKICVVKDDVRHQLLLNENFTDIEAVSTDVVCAQKLAAGEVGVWFGSSTSFPGIIKSAGVSAGAFRHMAKVGENNLYIAFNKDTPDAEVSRWQAALNAMKADGTFEEILQTY